MQNIEFIKSSKFEELKRLHFFGKKMVIKYSDIFKYKTLKILGEM